MHVRALHRWDLSTKEAADLQTRLAAKVIPKTGWPRPPRLLAGCDISVARHSKTGHAGVVLLEAGTLETVGEFTLTGSLPFPYVPGLLSFREGPLLIELFKQVQPSPDLIFFDGQGLAHPRRLGLASHLGLFLNAPALGCAKSRLVGHYQDPAQRQGARSPLVDGQGESIGAVLRTREGCKPIFVSVGHRIDLETAVDWTLRATGPYRIPEPTRRTHLLVTRIRKEAG
ncbi:MAG: deoxyribonuclease V [Nitrospinaceae bacterium]